HHVETVLRPYDPGYRAGGVGRLAYVALPRVACDRVNALRIDTGDDRDVLGTAERHEVTWTDRADRQDSLLKRSVAGPGHVQDRRNRRDRMRDLEPGGLQCVPNEDAA